MNDQFNSAFWIWTREAPEDSHVAAFRMEFDGIAADAELAFSADSMARVFVNGRWVADGPCRGWPESYYYDVVPVGDLLREGRNEIAALVRFYGAGTFQNLPQRPGILFEVRSGSECLVASGPGCEARVAVEWRAGTPKVSIQNPPFEWVDGMVTGPGWSPCEVICPAHQGPWKGLHRRDVRNLTYRHLADATPIARGRRVNPPMDHWSVPVVELCHPGLRSLNIHTSRACGLATCFQAPEPRSIPWENQHWRAFVNGREAVKTLEWKAGLNPMLFVVRQLFSHLHDAVLMLPQGAFEPVYAGDTSAWRLVDFPEFFYVGDDVRWCGQPETVREELKASYAEFCSQAGSTTGGRSALAAWLDARSSRLFHLEDECQRDPAGDFVMRSLQVRQTCQADEISLVSEDRQELELDLGTLTSGYFEIDLEAAEGTVVDVFAVEHVTADGTIQHTMGNRNGFRYVCREGRQMFQTLGRYFGRRAFVAVSGGQARIHGLRMIESLYPVKPIGSFRCSDPRLERIWNAASRTMELCMHDVFVDSLYEQTLWTGDAAVQQLYALWTFDARDIARRSMRLGAESLRRFPMVGAQVPSAWECLLPAWSFLWGISVRDEYYYSGDQAILEEMWPAVRQNLVAAETYLNASGLFDAPFWNLLEWAPMQIQNTCVIYNSQLMLAAVEAAREVAGWTHRADDVRCLRTLANRLRQALERVRAAGGGFFPDSITPDGIHCGRSLHPHFLALCYGQVEDENLVRFLEDPPEGTTGIASPFMTHFLYGAWERANRPDRLMADLIRHFQPMLDAGDETLWETLPGSTCAPAGWPTRSRCHGWSASPLYFIPRTVLGLRPTEPGSRSFELRPHLGHLDWAEGSVATPSGPIHIRVERENDRPTVAKMSKPENVRVKFRDLREGTA